jgi:hypothetical protein
MRYYSLSLTDPTSGQVWVPTPTGDGFALQGTGPTFTSYANGATIPGALNIEFDCPITPFNTPQGNTKITVWGVGLKMIGQAANLNGANITLAAGMKPGLPLATAAAGQAGIIMQGVVFQAYGNWQGVNQTLELICNPGAASYNNQDISWAWNAGTSMSSAIYQTLTQGFPAYKANVNVGASLILSNTEPGHYTSLANFAGAINDISLKAGIPTYGPSYAGVQITIIGNTIYAYDGTSPPKTTQIAFQDMIGQPTWIDAATVNFKTVLRSDIAAGGNTQFPPGIQSPYALTSQAAAVPNAPASSKTAFQGAFTVTEVHHFANFRQADADSWATAFNAVTSIATT